MSERPDACKHPLMPITLCLITQTSAHLTDVTVDVEAAVQRYNPDRLLLTRFRHDGLTTHRAARRILPVGDSVRTHSYSLRFRERNRQLQCCSEWRVNDSVPMKVVYAVYLRCGVHSEGDAVQAAVTNHTRETARMVGFAHGTQDAVQNGFGAL